MGIKKLDILNSILLLVVFAMLAIVANSALVYKDAPGRQTAQQQPLHTQQQTQVPIQQYASIVENPVFPGAPKKFTPLASSAANIKTTLRVNAAATSKVLLTGTYVSLAIHSASFAIFTNIDSRIQKSFKLGDDVFGYGRLSSVSQKSAALKRGSKETLFYMPKSAKPTMFEPKLTVSRSSARSNRLKYAQKVSETEWVVNQSAVLGAMENMSSVLSDARMTPISVNGKIYGFKVTEVVANGIFAAIGLNNNDIIKRVNEYEMTSPERAIQVLSALRGKTDFSIDIERRGRKVTLHYRVR